MSVVTIARETTVILILVSNNRFFAYCKGGNFNIPGHCSASSSAKQELSGSIYIW